MRERAIEQALSSSTAPRFLKRLRERALRHVRGAFTGATEAHRGKFQQADGGTCSSTIGETSKQSQPGLLGAESGDVETGGRGPEHVDAPIAATNRDLPAAVAAGEFRPDLYYRLAVVPLRLPSLRERAGDIPILAAHFLDAACRKNRVKPKRLDPDAIARLTRHAWPGNVRELWNAMERIAILPPTAPWEPPTSPSSIRERRPQLKSRPRRTPTSPR
jgi:transcriptional regulator with GAF, ATPase, and Fis domain